MYQYREKSNKSPKMTSHYQQLTLLRTERDPNELRLIQYVVFSN